MYALPFRSSMYNMYAEISDESPKELILSQSWCIASGPPVWTFGGQIKYTASTFAFGNDRSCRGTDDSALLRFATRALADGTAAASRFRFESMSLKFMFPPPWPPGQGGGRRFFLGKATGTGHSTTLRDSVREIRKAGRKKGHRARRSLPVCGVWAAQGSELRANDG